MGPSTIETAATPTKYAIRFSTFFRPQLNDQPLAALNTIARADAALGGQIL
jgi:hypothetical protein